MWYFISKKSWLTKSISAALICICLASGLFLYSASKNVNLDELKFLLTHIGKNVGRTPGSGQALSIPVILYHGVVADAKGENVTPEQFRNEMTALKQNGWQTIYLSDLEPYLKGEKNLPDKSFLLTFDDGRKDSYYPTDPILRELGFNALIFPIAGVVDANKAHLTSNELKKMIASGRWEIGSHGFDDHRQIASGNNGKKGNWLANLEWLPEQNRLETETEYVQRINMDMQRSKDFIKDKVGLIANTFAFPFNDYGQTENNNPRAMLEIARSSRRNYDLAFYQINPANGFSFNYPSPDPFMIKRIEITSSWTPEMLLGQLNNGMAKILPYSSNDNLDGWTAMRDKFEIDKESHKLTIGSGQNNTGNVAFLDGSLHWNDYNFDATVNRQKGSNFYLISRYQDDSNYLSCNYSDNNVRIEQKINDQTEILKQERIIIPFMKDDSGLSMSVQNNSAVCLINGNEIVRSDNISNELDHGGIGLKTWDAMPGNSEVVVEDIKVN